eukprot:5849420-Pyramimonas_sp.AAC.1
MARGGKKERIATARHKDRAQRDCEAENTASDREAQNKTYTTGRSAGGRDGRGGGRERKSSITKQVRHASVPKQTLVSPTAVADALSRGGAP